MIGKLAAGNEAIEKRVAGALGAAQRGARLSSRMLSFGRKQPLAPKVVHVGRLIDELDEMLRRSLGDSVRLGSGRARGRSKTMKSPLRPLRSPPWAAPRRFSSSKTTPPCARPRPICSQGSATACCTPSMPTRRWRSFKAA